MIIHEIHDLSNVLVIDLLKYHFATITDTDIIKNYHPDCSDLPGNLFYILEQGRYAKGKGKYFVIENNGEYICSAGWNEYELDSTIALLLTRMYVNTRYRTQYFVGKHILPQTIEEAQHYNKLWITSNSHNVMIYNWFSRAAEGKRTSLFNNWPDIYKKFKPVGKREVYYTIQDVVELDRTQL